MSSDGSRYVHLTLCSDELEPEDLGRRLGLAADDARTKGSPSPRLPTAPPASTNMWVLTEVGDSTDWPERMIDRVRARLAPAEEELHRLVREGRCTVHLGVYLYPSREREGDDGFMPTGYVGPGFGLDADAIAWLHGLRATFEVDIH